MEKSGENVIVCKANSIKWLFSKIRSIDTSSADFARYADRLLNVLAEEGLSYAESEEVIVETPCGKVDGVAPPNFGNMVAISIVRSGDILQEAVRRCSPEISVGKILIQRDETHPEKIPMLYYSKLPDIKNKTIILCDPMLATGGSALKAIEVLIENGAEEKNIFFLNVISCPEGIERLRIERPEMKIFTGCIDECLNADKYIVPGLGDFGDRYYNTQ